MADIPADNSPPSPADSSAMEALLNEHIANPPSPNDNEAVDIPAEKKDETPPPAETQPEGEEATPPVEEGETPEPPIEDGEKKPEDGKTPEKTTEEEPDDFEKEIDKFQLRKEAGPNTKKVIKILKEKAKGEHKLAKEFRTKYEESEKARAEAKPLTPEIEKDLEELRQFKSSIDIESDPAFNQHLETIKQTEEAAISMLRTWNMPENATKYIQANGGVLKFRTSQSLMPNNGQFKNEDGSTMTHEQWWDKNVEQRMTKAQKEDMGDVLGQIRQLHRNKDFAVQQAKENKDTFLKQRQDEENKSAEDWKNRIQAHAAKTLPQYGELAKEKPMPENATPEQKAAVEKHNAMYKKAEAIAQKYITEITPENLVEAAIAAAYSSVARSELKGQVDRAVKAETRVGELEKQIADIKAAGKTSNKGASTPATKTDKQPKNIRNDADAMAALMDQENK